MKEKSIKLNTQSVRKSFYKFVLSFLVLVFVSFVVVYLFFKSNALQQENIRQDILSYKEVLNRQQALKANIDTIYYQMNLLNTGKVENDLFLVNYISQNIQETKKIIATDSSTAFKQYSFLLSKLDTMLVLKSEITLISDKERMASQDYRECVGKMNKVKSELVRDPTRGFQIK